MKVKKHVMEKLRGLLLADETIEAAISCGSFHLHPGAIERPHDRDYLIVTDRRLVIVKGEWFLKGTGVTEYRRALVREAGVKNFLVGCTLTLRLDDGAGGELELKFENCGKPEGEAVAKVLACEADIKRCPACGRQLTGDFSFCPFCKASLKRLCASCGKPLQSEWANCPFCGKG